MADPQSRGIDIKVADDGSLIFVCLHLDSTGAKVTTGTTSVRIWHIIPTSGSIETFDWSDHTFKAGAITTPAAQATHLKAENNSYATGVWSYRLANLDAFENGHQYIVEFHNASASPPAVPRWFQYGWGELVGLVGLVAPVGNLEQCQLSSTSGITYAGLRGSLKLMVDRIFKADRRFVTSELIAQWVNSGYQELDRKLRWTRCNYWFTTTADTAEYTIPTAVREYIEVQMTDADGNVCKLKRISLGEYISYCATSTESGEPKYWVHHGDKLILYPTPDKATEAQPEDIYTVKIWGVVEPGDMSSDDERPGFPAHLHQLIIDQALVYVYRYFGQIEQAEGLDAYIETKIASERKEPAMDREGSGRVQPPPL